MNNKEYTQRALETALEYAKYDLETAKQFYKGSERCSQHCSDIKGIEEDIQIIQAALDKL